MTSTTYRYSTVVCCTVPAFQTTGAPRASHQPCRGTPTALGPHASRSGSLPCRRWQPLRRHKHFLRWASQMGRRGLTYAINSQWSTCEAHEGPVSRARQCRSEPESSGARAVRRSSRSGTKSAAGQKCLLVMAVVSLAMLAVRELRDSTRGASAETK
jgi:hypothetical protein